MRLKSIFLSFLFFLILNFHGQSVPLRFQGSVSDERSNLSGVTLQVSKSGKVMNNVLTDAGGRYYFELPIGGEYIITVSKEGYISKKFSVSTLGVPAEMASLRFPSVEASLTLFKRMEGIDYSLLNQPVNKFYFDVEREDFVYDENHLKQMKKGIELIKEQEKALLAKEKEREEQYNAAIKAGDKAFAKKDWTGALGFYEQSLKVKSEEAYPKAQIEKVNQALLEEKKNKEASELAAKNAADAAAAKALADKQAKEKAEAEALAKKQAEEKAAADALAKKQADELAAKKAAEAAAAAAIASKAAKEKADADAAKALADKQAKDKAEAEALAKKQADEAAAKALAEKQSQEKAAAEALAKKQTEEANAKKAAELAAAAAIADKLAKEKAASEALSKKQTEEAAAKKAKEEAEAKAKADKELADKQEKDKAAKAKAEADALAKKQADEAAAKKAADEAALKAKADKAILPVLGAADTKYASAIKKADEAFSKRRYYDAKTAYEEALMAKSGDVYAKTRLLECEKQINADANQKVDERQKELLSKYPPGVTEEIIPSESVVIIRRIVVKDKKAFVYEKKVFNWGGIACFRDGESITELTFEQETKK
ncbi:MAG: carboxypeptidase regulatory-like domain-containing protein [Bacteroidia bacterium]|nr:carboxypeptidase regulatory-like domain-containing protein [Bacteroidia bacterium]